MKPKQAIKIIADAAMTVLLLLLMTYERIGGSVHEWLGASVFMLFVLHLILNIKWTRPLFNWSVFIGLAKRAVKTDSSTLK